MQKISTDMKQLYEWVVFCKDQEYILTERQHEVLIDNQDKRFVEFPNCVIQPAMVSSMTKRLAKALKQMYPCAKCFTVGKINNKTCSKCEGSGVLLP